MTKYYHIIFSASFSALLFLPAKAMATGFPDSFAEYFALQEKEVTATVAGDLNGITVLSDVSYEEFKLVNEKENIQSLRDYLARMYLTDTAVEIAVSDFLKGVKANPGCAVALSQCLVTPNKGELAYLFDYEQQLLKIFVSPELLSESLAELGFYSPVKEGLAVINDSRLYLDSNMEDDFGVTFSNDTLIGLPVGYVAIDSQISKDSSEIYSAYYNLEYGRHRFQLGQTNGGFRSFNTTDFLFNAAGYDYAGLAWGSSYNLTKSVKGHSQSIYFFAPQNGLLEVYNGDRLLLTRNVTQGRQVISFSELPSGAYRITIKLKIGSTVAFEEERQVVNNQSFSLSKGAWDFYNAVGRFDDLEYTGNGDVRPVKYFGLGSLSYRVSDSLLIAGALTKSQDELYAQVGGSYYFRDLFNSTVTFGYFDVGDYFLSSTFDLSPFYLTWDRYKQNLKNGSSSLAYQLYGDSSFNELTVGVSGSLWGGFGYINYMQSQQLGAPYSGAHKTTNNAINGSWSHDFWGGQITINAGANYNKEYSTDYNIGLSWRRDLTQNSYLNLSSYFNQDGFSQASTDIYHNSTVGDWFVNSGVRTSFDDKHQASVDGSFSASGITRYSDNQIYGHISSKGSKSLSVSMQNTQILTSNGIHISTDNSESYLHVQTDRELSEKDRLFYNLSGDGGDAFRGPLKNNDSLIAISPYQYTHLLLDGETSYLDLSKDRAYFFSQPGSVYHFQTQLYPLKSQIFILSDMDKEPVSTLECRGEGCVSVEPLSNDGVFRVNYRNGANFELYSAQNLCISAWGALEQPYTQAYCLPGIKDEDALLAYKQKEARDIKKILFYLGRFDNEEAAQKIIDELKQAKIETKSIKVDPDLYVYATHPKTLTPKQHSTLLNLNAYVLEDTRSDSKFVTSRGFNYDF